jgi:hypothetical protein
MEENTQLQPDTSALFSALIAVQLMVQNPVKDTKGYSYKYAQLDQLIELSKAKLAEHGLGLLILPVGEIKDNCMTVKVTIFHKNGTHMVEHFQVPLKKGTNPTQDFGSAYTYARRYATLGVLNVAPEDDDGQGSVRATQELVKKATHKLDHHNGWEWAEAKGFKPETSTDRVLEKFLNLSTKELMEKIDAG